MAGGRRNPDPSRGGGRGRRAGGRGGRGDLPGSADAEPGRPAPSGAGRAPGTAACSKHGRDHTPRRWQTGDCNVGRSSGGAGRPRRRSARGDLRLDNAFEPWHNSTDRLALSELGAVTRVRWPYRALTPRFSPLPTLPERVAARQLRRLWTPPLLWTQTTAPTGVCKTAQTQFRTATTAIIFFFIKTSTNQATGPVHRHASRIDQFEVTADSQPRLRAQPLLDLLPPRGQGAGPRRRHPHRRRRPADGPPHRLDIQLQPTGDLLLRHTLHQMQVADLDPLGHPDHLRVLLARSTRRPCLATSIIARRALFPSAQGVPFQVATGSLYPFSMTSRG